MLMVPSGFITRPGFGLVPGVSATVLAVTGNAIEGIVDQHAGVLPPVPPLIDGNVSSTASISRVSVATVAVSLAVGSIALPGASPVAVAVLERVPATASAVVIKYVLPVATQLAVAPGANVAMLHARLGNSGSTTVTGAKVTLPVLVALNE